MKIYTIGFTQKSAAEFFELLRASGAKKLIDIRLNNTSQLAGFTKRDDLAYFSQQLCGMTYHPMPDLAPTRDILDALKKDDGPWSAYEQGFNALMVKRQAIERLDRSFFDDTPCCLLCSEATPHHCHRRLVAEAMQRRWPELEIRHL